MSMSWTIQRVEGASTTDVGKLPFYLLVAEVEAALQRLVCTRLSEQEVLSASLRREAGNHGDQLKRVGAERPNTITYGQGDVRFIARRVADKVQEA